MSLECLDINENFHKCFPMIKFNYSSWISIRSVADLVKVLAKYFKWDIEIFMGQTEEGGKLPLFQIFKQKGFIQPLEDIPCHWGNKISRERPTYIYRDQ